MMLIARLPYSKTVAIVDIVLAEAARTYDATTVG
jgi:hypothetical protein